MRVLPLVPAYVAAGFLNRSKCYFLVQLFENMLIPKLLLKSNSGRYKWGEIHKLLTSFSYL